MYNLYVVLFNVKDWSELDKFCCEQGIEIRDSYTPHAKHISAVFGDDAKYVRRGFSITDLTGGQIHDVWFAYGFSDFEKYCLNIPKERAKIKLRLAVNGTK